jgi:hypothetical protein
VPEHQLSRITPFLVTLSFAIVPFEYENSTRARKQAQIDGCTDVYAVNYNSSATTDDGSCNYDPHSLIPDFSGPFDGFTVDGNTFTFPSTAESWAGVANLNTDIYPLMFQGANDFIVFTASIPDWVNTDDDAQVKFRFEYNPYPDVDPAYNTNAVTVSGAENATYRIDIPDRGTETYSSFLLYVARSHYFSQIHITLSIFEY